jgi:hypothetical protein
MTETPGTTNFRFTSEDVDELTDALSRMVVSDHLPKEQWGLLLAIFAAAARNAEVEVETEGKFSGVTVLGGAVIEDPKDKKVKELREQLRKAYMPGGPQQKPFGDMVQPPKTADPPPPKK